MAQIKNISLYLNEKKGSQTDYLLVLGIYKTDPITELPDFGESPVGYTTRSVFDIDHAGWYSFKFDPVLDLEAGLYSIVLYHQYSYGDSNYAKTNFVEWIHSEDIETEKDLISFSTIDMGSYAYSYGTSDIYGYGYGYGEGLDYFNVLDASGNFEGTGADSFETDYINSYGYGYGYENIYFESNNKIKRCFKIYENFNDIEYDSVSGCMKINIPPSETSQLVLNNRQDFLEAEKDGTDVFINSLTLSDFGGRIYGADASLYDDNVETEWDKANFGLPTNDINSMALRNLSGNTDQFSVWMSCTPYYSGICNSIDGASSWHQIKYLNVEGTVETIVRNFSCVGIAEDNSFIIAFDNTVLDGYTDATQPEVGKVFYAVIASEEDFINEDLIWTQIGRIEDANGGIKTNKVFFQTETTIWAGTDRGMYLFENVLPYSWILKNTGLPTLPPKINDIEGFYNPLYTYGYGYGYEGSWYEELNYFDVFGILGTGEGYGLEEQDSFDWGYGYEKLYGYGDLNKIFIATEDGVYSYDGATWSLSGTVSYWENNEPLCLKLTDQNLYVGTSNGLARSSIEDGQFVNYYGLNSDDLFYPFGLSLSSVISIEINETNNSEIYVAQNYGIFISKNNGGNFTLVSEKLPEKRITDLLVNPINNRFLYITTQTVKYSSTLISLFIDSSGSMKANDPNELRLDAAKKIINQINQNSIAQIYYEVVRFGTKETDYEQTYFDSNKASIDFEGAELLTSSVQYTSSEIDASGIISSVTQARNYIDDCSGNYHYRTPLMDSLIVFSKGLIQSGAFWKYDSGKYWIDNIDSQFYNSLHKVCVVLTDGYDNCRDITNLQSDLDNINTVDSSKKNILTNLTKYFAETRCEVYIVGVGNNINYENLKALSDLHPFSHFLLASSDNEIFSGVSSYGTDDLDSGLVSYLDVADLILINEKTQKRIGTWKKIINLEELIILKNLVLETNIPPYTDCRYRVRTSFDKDIWGDWTDYLDYDDSSDINFSGQYIEIEIYIESERTFYSPEITSIIVNYFVPSKSIIAYNKLDSNGDSRDIYLTSIDSISLNEISNNDVKLDFYYLNADSIDIDRGIYINKNKRSVISRKISENLTTEDGYFYDAEMGPWFPSTIIPIYNGETKIDSKEYHLVPNAGKIIFYKKQLNDDESFKTFTVQFPKSDYYKILSRIKNYTTSSQEVSLYDISWMYYNFDLSTSIRTPLPLVQSQINKLNGYGKVYSENYPSSRGFSNTFILQFLLPSSFETGILAVTTGEYLSLQVDDSSSVNYKFFNQNTYFEKFNTVSSNSFAYVIAFTSEGILPSGSLSTSLVDASEYQGPELHYQANIQIETETEGGSLNLVIGDSSTYGIFSSGGRGVPSWLRQNNILFSPKDYSFGEFETNFIFANITSLESGVSRSSLNFVSLGDSNTSASVGSNRYPELIYKNVLSKKVYDATSYRNSGLEREFVHQCYDRLSSDLYSSSRSGYRNVVTILLGLESLLVSSSSVIDLSASQVWFGDDDYKGLSQIVTAAKEHGWEIVLMTLPPVVDKTGVSYNASLTNSKIRSFNSYIKSDLTNRFTYVDIYPSFVGTDGKAKTTYYESDGKTINQEGHSLIKTLFDNVSFVNGVGGTVITGSSAEYYTMPLKPSIKICGLSAKKIVILTPTKLKPSELFSITVLAVDNNGLIDRNFVGTINIDVETSNFIFINVRDIEFNSSDNGFKKISAFVESLSSGYSRIIAKFNEDEEYLYKSNPIFVENDSTTYLIGDFNVSSLLSDGRQDLDFIANYAKNIANINFVAISEDLDIFKSQNTNVANEWDYIRYKTNKLSESSFYFFNGIKFRSSLEYGERLIIFSSDNDTPETLMTNPMSIGDNPLSQLSQLSNWIGNNNYISIPIHSSYKNFKDSTVDRQREDIFKNRGFNFNNYRKIAGYSVLSNFLYVGESAVEVYSEHGKCLTLGEDSSSNENFINNDQSYYINYALKIGKKFGFVASSGGYASRPGYYVGDNSPITNLPQSQYLENITSIRGLTYILLERQITKNEIIQSVLDRKCYATSGARIYAEVSASFGSQTVGIGEVLYADSEDVDDDYKPIYDFTLTARIISDKAPWRKISVYRIHVDNEILKIKEENISGNIEDKSFSFIDNIDLGAGLSIKEKDVEGAEFAYYLMAEQADGHIVWISPIWLNFGRTNEITQESEELSQIKTPVWISAIPGQTDFIGNFSSSTDQTKPLAEFSIIDLLPENFIDPLSITVSSLSTRTRKTYTQGTVGKDTYLKVADKTLWAGGLRVYANPGQNIIYGTHCLRFLADLAEERLYYTDKTSGVNSSQYLQSSQSYKYLKDWSPYLSTSSIGYLSGRNKIFGYMISYTNTSTHIKSQYLLDNVVHGTVSAVDIYDPQTTMKIVREPFVYGSAGSWDMIYVGYSGIYPENKDREYTGKPEDFNIAYGINEDFAGLLSQSFTQDTHALYSTKSNSQNMEFAENVEITFEKTYSFDGVTTSNIYYPSSPSLIEENGTYKLYYIGWFQQNGSIYPALFCHQFNYLYNSEIVNFENTGYSVDSTKQTNVCFIFSKTQPIVNGYSSRNCSVDPEDLIWPQYRTDQRSNYLLQPTAWGNINPGFGIGFSWISVIKHDDGNYYVFYNKSKTSNVLGQYTSIPGTGILYSTDGINFYEYNSTATLKTEDIQKHIYPHVFKATGQWMMAYSDWDDQFWLTNNMRKTKYKAFTWRSVFDPIV